MKRTTVTIEQIGLIAATRGLAGAGLGLLLADKLPEKRRKSIGLKLLLVGALTTLPLVVEVIQGMKCQDKHKTP